MSRTTRGHAHAPHFPRYQWPMPRKAKPAVGHAYFYERNGEYCSDAPSVIQMGPDRHLLREGWVVRGRLRIKLK